MIGAEAVEETEDERGSDEEHVQAIVSARYPRSAVRELAAP